MTTRKYADNETPDLGDVVQLFDDAYGTGVITSVGDNSVVVERVHAGVSSTGQIQIGVERVSISKTRLYELPVYTTGPSGCICNRCR